MKSFLGIGCLIFIGFAGWKIGGQLSSDALGMALGILFGIMAGIPTALMVLAARRKEEEYRPRSNQRHSHQQLPASPYQHQPPVIVVTGNGAPGYGSTPQQVHPGYTASFPGKEGEPYPALPEPMENARPARQFRVVGEEDEWL
ncbi:hypothetical protein KFU94_54435 [Chloroflexi bacterium TSY]|nr:hypothetical protein [Chloroflexi bacterium TSY]